MSAVNLLTQLNELGIKIAARDGELKISAPPGTLTAELREQLVANKPELLDLLQSAQRLREAPVQKFIVPEHSGPVPLSFAQQRLWFLDALDPGLAVYNIPLAVRLHGDLNIAAMAMALHDLIDRHESLRTNFVADDDDQPRQLIHEFLAHAIDSTDLSAASEAELQATLTRLHQQPFDLAQGPLLRTHLLKLGEHEHVLLFVIHHIISDAWSLDVLFRELVSFYEGHRANQPVKLPALPVQYADYAIWQREWLKSSQMQQQLDYWKHQLGDAPTVLELPTDRPRPAVQTFNGARQLVTLPKSIADQLNELAGKSHATLFMVLLAACNVLLSRWSRQDDIVIGTPVAGRQHTELEALIGFFINTLPLRTDLSDDPDFRTLVERIRQTALDAFDNQSLPFEKLVEELQPERDQSHAPLYQVVFMLQNAPAGGDMFSGLTASGIRFDYGTTKFDLNIAAAELEEGLGVEFEYNTDLFDAETIERLAGHFVTLLKGIVAAPDTRISELALLDADEVRTLTHDWNQTALTFDPAETMHGCFEAQAVAHPDAVAVYHPQGTFSYTELNRRANVLAKHLQTLGVGPETLVGISTPRNPEMLTGLLAILKAGGAYVPLDPNYPPERVRYMLEDSQAPVLLTHSSVLANLPEHGAHTVCLDEFDFGTDACANLSVAVSGAQLGYVIYTSGSTGQPKGVCIEHGNAVALIRWADTVFNADEWAGVLASTSICFDLSVFEIFCTLGVGGRIVLVDDALGLPALPDDADVRLINTVPSAIAELNRMQGIPASVKTINLAGEPLAPALVDELYAREHIRNVNDLYGPSEDTTYSTWTRREAGAAASIGRPIANTRVYLLDAHLKLVPIGVPGELCLAGAGVTRGYLHQPELTAEKYIDDPFGKPGEKLYRTGDLARYRADGTLEYLGRLDHQVKLRGFRIELGEIETRLKQHDSIADARVIIREDTPGDKKLVAYLVAEPAAEIDVAELRAHLQTSLPNYMLPQAMVELEAIPLTPNGKLDRKALTAPDASATAHGDYAEPTTPVELALAEIWQQLLGVEQVGLHDDFFALGGHSLLATRVAARVRREFGTTIELRALFTNPTIGQLARLIDPDSAATAATRRQRIPRREQANNVPLSFAQQRLWILNEIDPDGSVYNIPWAISIAGELDQQALQGAVDDLVARHESLRTCFVQSDAQPEPVQAIAEFVSVPLQNIPTPDADAQRATIERLVKQSFDLSTCPLLRIYLIECDSADTVLLINIHHIIADGWSLDVINRELSQLYDARVAGAEANLPALPIQYADYAVWQRAWLEQGELDRQLSYWQTQLANAQTVLELPTDRTRPPIQTYNGASFYAQLPAAPTSGLKALAQQHNATLYMTLLAAFNILLYRYTGQEDILVGSPIAGREDDELENQIGIFINTLALRTQLDGDDHFSALLDQARETTLGAYEHQALPFERLVEALQPERDVSRSPLFQVMLILQNAPFDSMQFASHVTRPVDFAIGNTKFDLTLTAWEREGGLGLQFEYNTDLYDAETVAALAGHFTTLVNSIVARPDTAIGALPLLSEDESERLVDDWNATTTEYDHNTPLHELIERQADLNPAATALVCDEEPLLYFELNRRANVLAARLAECGVGPETLVGVCAPRSNDLIVGLLAILKAGGAYVPLDPYYPQERIDFMLKDCGATVLLTHTALRQRFHAAQGLGQHGITTINLDEFDYGLDPEPNRGADVTGANLAYVIYTSGSTGLPKGVAIEHHSVVNFLRSMVDYPGITSKDRWLAVTTLSFDISILEIFGPLVAGGTVFLADRDTANDGYALARAIESSGATIMQATPATWQMLLQSGWQGSAGLTILCGGEALEAPLAEQLLNAGKALWNMYGPTETTIWSTCSQVQQHDDIHIGGPIANTSCYIVDQQNQLVPAGVTGELLIGGEGLARGYLHRAELSAEKFIANTLGGEHEKLYRTGDLARYRRDGALECLGRADQQVKLRGYRIELGEIEAIINQHASIHEARVIVREDQPGDKRLVAYAVAEQPGIEVATLRDFVSQQLPAYMVPQAFVEIDAIPLTPNGKFDRKALPVPDAQAAVVNEYVAPATPLEKQLADIWQELLGIDPIGMRDDFFELGGHSLLATRVVARIRSDLGKNIELLTLFVNPTIEKLAHQIGDTAATAAAVAIPKRPAAATAPLSFAQQRLWILDEIDSDSAVYNIPWAVTLDSDVDRRALNAAVYDLVARHESLRTRFVRGEDGPLQEIAAEVPASVSVSSTATTQERRAELERLAQRPFDLSKAPLVRFHLIECDAADSVLLINIHHIIADVWSLDIINRELSALYKAHRQKTGADLPKLAIQYADYAVWQRNWLQGSELDRQLEYWRRHLEGTPGILELPTDRPRPATQTFNGARVFQYLPAADLQALQQLSRNHGTTLYMTLLAVFETLLYRYSGQSDIVVGTPIAGREYSELDNVVGFFINTLALRTELDGTQGFDQLLKNVRQTTLDAFAHQALPFEKLVEELQPERDVSRSPLFQVMFILQNAPFESAEFEQLGAQQVEFDINTTKFDLTLTSWEHADGLGLQFEYNTDLFDATTIEQLARHYALLLNTVCVTPERAIADLPLLDATERNTIIEQWNATEQPFAAASGVKQLVEQQVEQTPDKIAVRFGANTMSYAELNRRANILAAKLAADGVIAGSRIAICCPRSLELAIAALAAVKSGGCYVAIDPDYPAERITAMLDDSGAMLVLTHSAIELPATTANPVTLDTVDFNGDAGNPTHNPKPSDPLYCIYTSGSTGQPKGVQLSHAGLANLLNWQLQHPRLGKAARTLQFASFSFDVSFQEMFGTWSSGGELVMISDAQRHDLAGLANFIAAADIERLFLPFAALQPLAESWVANESALHLEDIVVAGEQLKVTHAVRKLYRRLDGAALHNHYGPSETHVVTALTLQDNVTQWPTLPSIGSPIANTRCYVLDERQQPCPAGVPGELYLGGTQVALGYVNRAELNAEKFIRSPFVDGDRLYRSGDKVRFLQDGSLEFLGRIDDQFKWRGYRIEPGEIEAALAAQPDVLDAVVVLRDDDPDDVRLVAYVTPAGDTPVDIAALKAALARQLPEYMQPSLIMPLDKLPLTPSGKIARRALPVPHYGRDQSVVFVQPETATEKLLAAIWCELLKLEKISIHDNFFKLGGHSLTAVRMVLKVRERCGVNIEVRDLFAQPTIARFAELIDLTAGEVPVMTAIPRADRSAAIPLSSAQQRLWFLARLDDNSAVYNVSGAIKLVGRLDLGALQLAINDIVRRHEALRTTFANSDSGPIQIIHPDLPISITRHAAVELLTEDLYKAIAEIANAPFNIETGPLLRIELIELAENAWIVVIVMHHIISDGWSINVFNRELATHYAAHRVGEAVDLEPLPLQYADYAAWQQQQLCGKQLEELLNFWSGLLGDAPASLDLPTDRPRPQVQSFNGSSYSCEVNAADLAALRTLTTDHNASLFMGLLTAFNILLSRWSNQKDIVIGTPVAGRERSELETLIGVFINTLPLRTQLEDDPTCSELLERVRTTVLDCFAHQSLPFEKIVEELQPERNLSQSPIFQTAFVLQNAPEPGIQLDNFSISDIQLQSQTTKYDLTLAAWETGKDKNAGGLGLFFEYNTDLFDAETIERLAGHFVTLLKGIVATPDTRVSELALLDADEVRTLTHDWNQTALTFDPAETMHGCFEAQAVAHPDAVAVYHPQGTFSYTELNRRANVLAKHLQTLGVGPETLVGISTPRNPEMLTGLLAILKAGGAYVPLDPNYPPERVRYMLEDSQAPVLLTHSSVLANLPEHAAQTVCLDAFDFGTDACANLSVAVSGAQLGYVIYTSGSTGQPKGVCIEHGNAVALIRWADTVFRADEWAGVLASTSICFDLSVFEIFCTLGLGGRIVLVDDALGLPALPDDADVRLINTVPSAIAELNRMQGIPASVKTINLAGEPLAPALVDELYARDHIRNVNDLYGPSEDTTYSTWTRREAGAAASIGRPIANTRVYLLDAHLKLVPIGVPGELCLAGAGVTRGYLHQPELTAEKYIDDPFGKPGEKLYRTGDLARYRADGTLEYLGRLDHQVKLRGFRIELGEIETRLKQHDSIADARVIIREDTPGDKKLVAYLVAEPAAEIDVAELRAHLQTSLPNYMLPQAMVELEAIPLTPNGKLDRKALPAPDASATAHGDYAEPTTPVELALAEIWQQLLGVEQVGLHDDFFALGGHSLLTIRLITEISKTSGVHLDIADVFEQPTVGELAKLFPADTKFAIEISRRKIKRGLVSRGMATIAGWFGRKAQ